MGRDGTATVTGGTVGEGRSTAARVMAIASGTLGLVALCGGLGWLQASALAGDGTAGLAVGAGLGLILGCCLALAVLAPGRTGMALSVGTVAVLAAAGGMRGWLLGPSWPAGAAVGGVAGAAIAATLALGKRKGSGGDRPRP